MHACFIKAAVLVPLAFAVTTLAQPVGTVFTYQGELRDNGTPADGIYDFRFYLWDSPVGGAPMGDVVCLDSVAVVGGRFTVDLSTGTAFNGVAQYLEVEARPDAGSSCGSGGAYTTLVPRQRLAAAPSASFAISAAAGAFSVNRSSSVAPQFISAGAPFSFPSTSKVSLFNVLLLDRLDSTASAQAPLALSASTAGGLRLNLANNIVGGDSSNMLATGSADGEGAGRLLIRDQTGAAVCIALDSSSRVDLGTTVHAVESSLLSTHNPTGSAWRAAGPKIADPYWASKPSASSAP